MPGVEDTWMAVVNPHAGTGKTAEIWKKAETQLCRFGKEYDYRYTGCRNHATEIAYRAASSGYRKFIAVGGDGTVHEVLEGIMRHIEESETFGSGSKVSDFFLAVIPVGSGNDWIRIHGITDDVEKTIELMLNGSFVLQDVVKVSVLAPSSDCSHPSSAVPVRTSYMINIGGVGFDARVCDRVNRKKSEGKKGSLLYINSLVYNLLHYSAFPAAVFCDDKKVFDGNCFSVAVGTGKYSGGGLRQTPEAIFNDGLIDYTIIPPYPVTRILWEAPKLFTGNLLNVKGLVHGRCRSLTVVPSSPGPALVEVDGEIVGNAPVRFEVMSDQINVLHFGE